MGPLKRQTYTSTFGCDKVTANFYSCPEQLENSVHFEGSVSKYWTTMKCNCEQRETWGEPGFPTGHFTVLGPRMGELQTLSYGSRDQHSGSRGVQNAGSR